MKNIFQINAGNLLVRCLSSADNSLLGHRRRDSLDIGAGATAYEVAIGASFCDNASMSPASIGS